MNSKTNTAGIFDGLSEKNVDRTSALDRFFIPHARALIIQSNAERLLREAKRNPALAARSIVFTGVSGVGKSEALLVFSKAITEVELKARGVAEDGTVCDEDGLTKRRIIPVVYINVPESANLKDFYTNFLQALGDENPVGTVPSMRSRVQISVKNAETSIIIVDELQHLFDTENMRVKRNVANAIKRLLDVLHVPIVICGLEQAAEIFGPSLETKRRTDFCIRITPYDLKNPQDHRDFLDFLANYDDALVETRCFHKQSGLSDEIRATRIHYAARGCVSHVARLIKAAGTRAIERGANCISDDDLMTACDAIFMLEPKEINVNPFRTSDTPAFHYRATQTTARRKSPATPRTGQRQTNSGRRGASAKSVRKASSSKGHAKTSKAS